MVSTFQWMAGVPSHFKFGLILLLLISSCAKKSLPFIETEGFEIEQDQSHVDHVSIDSLTFASGLRLWILEGAIVNGGKEYPYRSVYNSNPLKLKVLPISVVPPTCMNVGTDQSITTKLIIDGSSVTISWRTNGQFLMIRTSLTSGH